MQFVQYKLLPLLIVSILEYIACESNSIDLDESPLEQGQLQFAHIIFRHGDRTPIDPYPTDPWKDRKYWPEGYGELTTIGKQQHYALGQFFARRYQCLLVDDEYPTDTIHVQSTDVDRTLMSAEANLAGFFPPREGQRFDNGMPWQPIPIHTLPEPLDHVLAAKKPCPRYEYAFKKYTETPAYRAILQKLKPLFQYISQHSGREYRTIQEAQNFYNTLWIEELKNRTLPEWTSNIYVPGGELEWVSNFAFQETSATPEMARLKVGFLLREILERSQSKAKGTLTRDRSVWMYSAHDTTLANILNALGLFELHNPPYASSVLVELYKTENEHYLQFFYRNTTDENLTPLRIPNCGTKCTIKKFRQIYKAILPTGDYESECRTSIWSMTYTDVDFSRLENGIISLLVFTVLMALIGVLSCRYCEREATRRRYHRI